MNFKVMSQRLRRMRVIELHSELDQDLVERMILFLHLLMVAAALLGLPSLDEVGHALKDFVSPAKVLEDEVLAVQLEEPMIQFVFLRGPMPLLNVSGLFLPALYFGTEASLLWFFFVLLPGQSDMALFPEQ